METIPTTSRSLDRYCHINVDTFEKQCKDIARKMVFNVFMVNIFY